MKSEKMNRRKLKSGWHISQFTHVKSFKGIDVHVKVKSETQSAPTDEK